CYKNTFLCSSVALHNHIPFNCYKNTFLLVFHKIFLIFLAILHRLSGEILTESSSRHLAEVLRKNERLNRLDLSLGNLDDKAMEVLCEGLKYPECAIETLELSGEILTESSSRHLAEVLKKNQRLNVLYLSLKNPDDKPMEVLCEGLKHPECAIKTLQGSSVALHNHIPFNCYKNTFLLVFHKIIVIFLALLHRLSGEILTESSSRHLAKVLRKKQRLNVLDLSLKNPDDKAMEVLCEGLNHPESAIKTLELFGKILTESSSRHLAEVLRKSQRLNVLYLSLKNPDDKAMEVLCEGLNHPECAIKTLQ
uniref:NACHT LRR and PYD domain-containing protein n=1 Tax=Pseudonaja textilis TaxID=8673 RepID=A0A670ZEJ6_PSETE